LLITISGLPGAGTSTVARLVADALGLDRVDGGSVFRAMAAERGLDVGEFSTVAEGDPEIDLDVDQRLANRARQGGVVLESRLAGWIVTNEGLESTRVWIDAAEVERSRRVAAREGVDTEVALEANRGREASECRRYQIYYGIDLEDRSVYDLVIDSTGTTPESIAESIVGAASK
jgi:predicted cytidylate kinase